MNVRRVDRATLLILVCQTMVLFSVTSSGAAAELTQGGGPVYGSEERVLWLGSFVKNTDPGATYERLELYLYASLAEALYALPQNERHYRSLAELTRGWQISVTRTDGSLQFGWYPSSSELSPLRIVHAQDRYSAWRYLGEVNVGIYIPTSQFDGNGDGWNLGPDDYVITRTDLLPGAAIAYDSAGNAYPAEGYAYSVRLIPEPSSLALLLLAPAYLLTRARRS